MPYDEYQHLRESADEALYTAKCGRRDVHGVHVIRGSDFCVGNKYPRVTQVPFDPYAAIYAAEADPKEGPLP